MSVKWFCDVCKKEMKRNVVDKRLKGMVDFSDKRVLIEVMVGVENTWNDGEICMKCLHDVLVELINREEDKNARKETK